ncbi:uncharacterized protein [Parasteatoda tepidariorum]|uniref:uncharacterized protein n=1 Tax=Parasteatoda tepidariorum TaxID=114398 RepID=UPI00077FCCED|nr:uncharacterized protein LOC107440224 [Parasteatoda tepidariorum]XP_015908569.1 uncharacterized protein LOC107440224 [Parasteatoda tepidariorum]
MDWISHLATGIAIFRLVLICCGMWIQLRAISKRNIVQDCQKRCFALAGITYLLGLLPQSLILLLVSSDLVSSVLDSGYLCMAQKFVCMIAVALHNLIFINWILEYIYSLRIKSNNYILSFIKHKAFVYFSASYVTILILCRSYFMHDGDSKTFYTDLATKSGNSSFSYWISSPAERPSQVVRLQLLLCESSLEENEILSYLCVSYTFLLLPLFLLGVIYKWKYGKGKEDVSENTSEEILDKANEGGQQCLWWEREENIQRFLSTFITIWFHFIQPVIFCTHREHFVDFGVHLLLTICVFIPWTLSENDYDSLRSWV